MTVLLLPFQFGYLLILLLAWLFWVGLSILSWIIVVRWESLSCFWFLKEKLRFLLLSITLPVCLSYVAFIMLRYIHSILTLLRGFFLNHKRMLNFVECFFCIYWDDHIICVHFFNMVYHIDWLADIELGLHPWNKSHLIVMFYAFNALLNSVC